MSKGNVMLLLELVVDSKAQTIQMMRSMAHKIQNKVIIGSEFYKDVVLNSLF
jgi:hypothetical protein